MKPYGLTKRDIMDSDDVAGIQKYGRKTSMGQIPGPGGDTRAQIKGSDKKRRARRMWKKRTRAEVKIQINKELNS